MLAEIGSHFQVDGTFASCERYTGGHINDTYFANYEYAGGMRRYVHQRINTNVFRDAHALIQNVGSVTRHIRAKLESRGAPDIDRRVLRVVPTHAGADLLERDGEYWRTYAFVERTRTRFRVETPADAYGAAYAFGEFAALLADLPVAQLEETIPGFHDTPARVRALGWRRQPTLRSVSHLQRTNSLWRGTSAAFACARRSCAARRFAAASHAQRHQDHERFVRRTDRRGGVRGGSRYGDAGTNVVRRGRDDSNRMLARIRRRTGSGEHRRRPRIIASGPQWIHGRCARSVNPRRACIARVGRTRACI